MHISRSSDSFVPSRVRFRKTAMASDSILDVMTFKATPSCFQKVVRDIECRRGDDLFSVRMGNSSDVDLFFSLKIANGCSIHLLPENRHETIPEISAGTSISFLGQRGCSMSFDSVTSDIVQQTRSIGRATQTKQVRRVDFNLKYPTVRR